MELRHLRYFVSVVVHGNFSRAAGTLCLTQPALSRQIKNLEDEIGLSLFVRKPNALSLTEEGEVFYEEAQEVLLRVNEAVRRVRKRPRTEGLRVGYVHSLTASIMPRVVEKFQSSNKNVRIELLDLATYDMGQKAAAGQLDMAILPKSMAHHFKGFQWVELQSLTPILVMSGKNPLAKLTKIPPEKLRDKPLYGLGPTKYPEYVPRLRDILKPFGVKPRLASQAADDIAALFIALEANAGMAVLTEGVTKMLPSTLVVRRFSPELAPLVIAAGLPATQPNPHAEMFVKLLLSEINKTSVVKLRLGKGRRTMAKIDAHRRAGVSKKTTRIIS
jgi:DNA-binding transcriptional LysR family regulator